MNRVFVGWDRREVLPWHVLCHSIIENTSQPVSVAPVKLSHLPLTRPVEGSTEFSLSRFLVPWLCGYEGLALFMDCDMLVSCDVAELFALHDGSAVQVVQHDYTPKDAAKFYGNVQKPYPKKNWSSLMLFDCAQCTALTPEYVNTASPMALHQFQWTDSVGSLPREYNHLVGEYDHDLDAKIVHWTNGGPWLSKYSGTEYAHDWIGARFKMNFCVNER